MADETVLVVDDHPLTREALAALLGQHGFAVVGQAADGEEAIELAGRLHPRLVLLDLSMPGLPGLDALPRLRAGHAPAAGARSRPTAPPRRGRRRAGSRRSARAARSSGGTRRLLR